MQMIATARKLDWGGWVRGIIGAFVSGGAGAISAGTAASYLDKKHDMPIFPLMGLTFLISGIVSLAKYLQLTPVPNVEPPAA